MIGHFAEGSTFFSIYPHFAEGSREIDVLNIKIDNLKKTRDLLLPRLIS
jgi:hypothetical protein